MEHGALSLASHRTMIPLTVNLTARQRQELLELAAAHSIASGKPISVSALARELLAEAIEQRGSAA